MDREQTLKISLLLAAVVFSPIPLPLEDSPKPSSVVTGVAPRPVVEITETRQWGMLVEAVKDETLIRDDELAEVVTLAIENAASEFDINPWLIMSLIRIESAGRPEVVSHAGAIGLTQILPGTAAEIADELHVAEYDLRNPAQNVRFGTYYLSQLLERFDGNRAVALAAYNFGPTAISRRLRNGEPLPTVYATKILSRV